MNAENLEKLKQSVSEFPLPFACVPWGHHVRIVQHSKNIEEALFYVGYTIREGISRDILTRVMKDDIYKKQGSVPNNFSQHLTPQLAQMARYVVKENYDFGFATVERETYNESELEKALHDNITALLLEMGNGFAFIGKQKEILFMLFFASTISSVVYLRCRMQIQAKPMNRKRFWSCLLSNGGRNCSKRVTA